MWVTRTLKQSGGRSSAELARNRLFLHEGKLRVDPSFPELFSISGAKALVGPSVKCAAKARLVMAAITVAVGLASCSRPVELPDYGVVPPFQMVDFNGHSFEGSRLAGKVWIADFIYTNCPAECPLMSAKMHKVAKQVDGMADVQIVSFSVDPERDTPAALLQFARRYGGPIPQWTFLTGSPETVHQLAYTTFHVGDVLGKISHSTKFVLVDKRGHLRGYYSSLGQDDIPRLLQDLSSLRRQSAS